MEDHPQGDKQNVSSTAEYWLEHIRKWQESGLSKAEYCRQNELARHRFYYRCQRFQRVAPEEGTAVALPFQASDLVSSRSSLTITVGERFHVAVEGDFHPPILQKLIQTLEQMP
jgi:hypothetical protein